MNHPHEPSASDPPAFYTAEEVRQRLSVSTIVFWRYRPLDGAALETLVSAGIGKIELAESREQFDMADTESMRLIGEACRSCGMALAAYHACFTTFDGVETEGQRQALVDRCRRQMDTMLELGGNVWGSHMRIGDPADPGWQRTYRELARHLEGTDAWIVIENGGIDHVLQGLDRIDHPKVGMLLDICHEWNEAGDNVMCHPGEPTRLIQRCRPHLRHVHLHGYVNGRGHQPPFAAGDTMQWVELFEALHATGYAGHLNFEPAASRRAIPAVGDFPDRIVEWALHR